MILTNQFHDIIPGSSIRQVYEQCEKDYAAIRSLAEPHKTQAEAKLAANLSKANGYVVINPNPTEGNGIVRLNGKSVAVNNIPPKGYACVKAFDETNTVKVSRTECENRRYRLTFD